MGDRVKSKKTNILKHEKTFISPTRLYVALVCISVIFLIGMSIFENLDEYKARREPGYRIVQNCKVDDIEDKDAPLGIIKEYRWKLEDIKEGENFLVFYVIHQYVEVYFDGRLMYSLKPQVGNIIGKTIGYNWGEIPIYPEDEGVEVCVDIIPVYNDVVNSQVDFFIGSKFMIYVNQL